jgi:hypothetical protein
MIIKAKNCTCETKSGERIITTTENIMILFGGKFVIETAAQTFVYFDHNKQVYNVTSKVRSSLSYGHDERYGKYVAVKKSKVQNESFH